MKKLFRNYRPSVRLGKHGHPMRDPGGHDIDITSDLTDGSDGVLGDALPYNGQSDNSQMATPPGTQPKHGEAQPRTGADTPPVKEPSLRDQLSSAFKGPDDKPVAQADGQTATAPALTQDGEGKYRNADGTFANAEQIAAFTAATTLPANTQEQSQSPIISGLTLAEAQQFQSLPEGLRTLYERTMEGLNTRAARYGEYDQIEGLLGPRREAFAQSGTTPVAALNQLFALSDFAGRDPGNFVMWFADQHKLDLDVLLDARDAEQANVDPKVRELEAQVQQLTGTVQQFTQQGQQTAQQAMLAEVQAFGTEKDEGGAFKRPYITEVMDEWVVQVNAVRTANPSMPNTDVLEKAYQNACWANPAVRGKMQQATQASTAADAARVQAAKDAGSSVTGGPSGSGTAAPNNSNRTLREELEEQFRASAV